MGKFVSGRITTERKEMRYAMSKEMNNRNFVPRAALYASPTLAACQSSLPILRANASMPCSSARLMSR